MQKEQLEQMIKLAVKSGKLVLGYRSSLKNLERARLIVISGDCPSKIRSGLKLSYLVYPGRATELGALCGKPFPVACLAVLE